LHTHSLEKHRCAWAQHDILTQSYHDQEWGVPVHEDEVLFEFLTLEGAQAGLSWITILKKRQNYKHAFANFRVEKLLNFSDIERQELLNNQGIVRNKLKIASVFNNAVAFLKIQQEYESFDNYIWQFVQGKTIQNHWQTVLDIPAKTDISDAMSKELKKRGFKFVGSTICYAFMQAVGMVNDHTVDCFKYQTTNSA
jgi:DNA-3-methyladenine glycosylase I